MDKKKKVKMEREQMKYYANQFLEEHYGDDPVQEDVKIWWDTYIGKSVAGFTKFFSIVRKGYKKKDKKYLNVQQHNDISSAFLRRERRSARRDRDDENERAY